MTEAVCPPAPVPACDQLLNLPFVLSASSQYAAAMAIAPQAAACLLICLFVAHGIFNAFKIIFAGPGFFLSQIYPSAGNLII